MRLFFAGIATATAGIAFSVGTATGGHVRPERIGARGVSTEALNSVVRRYCATCHSATSRQGNRSLRAQIMPPPGSRSPKGDTLLSLVETLEETIDKAAKPNPGNRTFQRLNR